MTEYEALGIVLDLASQNALEDDTELVEQYSLQQEALEIVNEMYERLEMA